MNALSLLASSLPLLAGGALAAQAQVTVLRGGRVLPVAQPAIESGTVVLHEGRITAVGDAALAVPDGARVIDCSGCTVTPGLIDAGASWGMRDTDANEQGDEVTPHLDVLDAVDPADARFARASRDGVTAVRLMPGNRNVIGGLGAVLKTRGETVADMLIKDHIGLRMTTGREPAQGNRAIRGGAPVGIYYRRPTTRMGVVWEVRRAFYDAMAYRERRTAEVPEPADASKEVLLQVIDGKLDVHATARAEQDIRTALRLGEEFGFRPVLEEVTEAWEVVELLAASKVECLIGSPSTARAAGGDAIDGARGRWHTLTLLAQAGVPFAIQTGADPGSKSLWEEALFAARNGLEPVTALRAVTLAPAQILGVDDRIGSLQPGRDADVVVWSGDVFDPTSTPRHVFIGGEEVQS